MYSAKSKTASVSLLLAYIIFVCTMSGIEDFFVSPYITSLSTQNPMLILFDPLWKLLFWLLPSFLYIKYIEKQDPLTYLKLNRRIGWGLLWGIVSAVIVVLLVLSTKYLLLHQHFHTDKPYTKPGAQRGNPGRVYRRDPFPRGYFSKTPGDVRLLVGSHPGRTGLCRAPYCLLDFAWGLTNIYTQ